VLTESNLLFTNGRIITHPDAPERAEPVAMGVGSGRIEALGQDALDWSANRDAEVIDLDGGVLLPAFGDGHCHPTLAGREWAGPKVRGASSVDEIIDAVRRWAEEHPEAPWIVGGSYDATLVPESRFDARWLDAVTCPTVWLP